MNPRDEFKLESRADIMLRLDSKPEPCKLACGCITVQVRHEKGYDSYIRYSKQCAKDKKARNHV